MDKAIQIQDNIRDVLLHLVGGHPTFSESAKNINVLLYKLHALDLESYKSEEIQKEAHEIFDKVISTLTESVKKNQISNIHAYGIVNMIGEMRKADFDYLNNDYLPTLTKKFKDIQQISRDMQKSTIELKDVFANEEKPSGFTKILNNIFSFRATYKNESESKKDIKPR